MTSELLAALRVWYDSNWYKIDCFSAQELRRILDEHEARAAKQGATQPCEGSASQNPLYLPALP